MRGGLVCRNAVQDGLWDCTLQYLLHHKWAGHTFRRLHVPNFDFPSASLSKYMLDRAGSIKVE